VTSQTRVFSELWLELAERFVPFERKRTVVYKRKFTVRRFSDASDVRELKSSTCWGFWDYSECEESAGIANRDPLLQGIIPGILFMLPIRYAS